MKKLLLVLAVVVVAGFLGCQKAEAHSSVTNVTNVVASDPHSVAGVKIDAPNLVQLTENTTLGLEGGKDILKDVFQNDTRDYYESDKAYFAYLKLTWDGCLLNCKEE